MQCYLLLFDPTFRVLLGRKGSRSLRYGGLSVPSTRIVNNPEQWVIPGGASEPNERYDEAASREFKEETGLDMSANPGVANARGGSLLHSGADEFYVLYVRVGPGTLDRLAQAIEQNIRMDVPADDELVEVGVFNHATAVHELLRTPAADAKLPVNTSLRRDWFLAAVADLKEVSSLMAL